MSLLTRMPNDLAGRYADWGESATYTPSGGEGSSVTAIITREGQAEDDRALQHRAEIRLRVSEVASRPGVGDTVAATDDADETETWRLAEPARQLAGEWICKAERAVKATFRR